MERNEVKIHNFYEVITFCIYLRNYHDQQSLQKIDAVTSKAYTPPQGTVTSKAYTPPQGTVTSKVYTPPQGTVTSKAYTPPQGTVTSKAYTRPPHHSKKFIHSHVSAVLLDVHLLQQETMKPV